MRIALALAAALAFTPVAAASKVEVSRMVVASAEQAGVPADLAMAIAQVESDFNPKAFHDGARGVMQVIPSTARAMGYRGEPAGLHDAKTGIDVGVRYLRHCLDSRDWNVPQAIACYNGTTHERTRYVRKVLKTISSAKLVDVD